jgi:Holliday junction resolvasome RuvABC endonuclease subunit
VREDGQIVTNLSCVLTSKKFENIYMKAAEIKKELEKINKNYTIDEIYIEEALLNFKFGRTSAKTLSMLHKFNGIVSYICYEVFNIEPIHINASSARKLAGLKKVPVKHQHSKQVSPTKIKVFEHLVASEPSFKFLTTRTGNVKTEAYDRADAIIVAKAGAAECRKQKKSES